MNSPYNILNLPHFLEYELIVETYRNAKKRYYTNDHPTQISKDEFNIALQIYLDAFKARQCKVDKLNLAWENGNDAAAAQIKCDLLDLT